MRDLQIHLIAILVVAFYKSHVHGCSSNETQGSVLQAPQPHFDLNDAASTNQSSPPCTSVNSGASINSGISGQRYRWKDFNVWIHPDYTNNERDIINNAMYNLMQVLPCINFGIWPTDSTPSGDYVRILPGQGCNSYVGKQGGRQDMNLQRPGCVSVSTAMHEMIHALGFDHEQNRPDRDDYINVYYDNIEPEYRFAYDKAIGSQTFGVPYDYQSIMHYHDRDFGINNAITMKAKNGRKLGSGNSLTSFDERKLKAMYKCN